MIMTEQFNMAKTNFEAVKQGVYLILVYPLSHFGIYPISFWYKAYLNMIYPSSPNGIHIITIH